MDCKTSQGRFTTKRDGPKVSKFSIETQELIQSMMRESRLSNFQQRQINNQIENGGTLPLTCNPTSSTKPSKSEVRVSKGPVLPSRPQKRSAEKCSAGDNYTREPFRPRPTRDLEKEKRRLQNILATGKDETPPSSVQTCTTETEDTETDRFQEVLEEIEDRRQFLEEMMALGRGNQYVHMINTEISQKIHELELIDRARSEEHRTLMMKQKANATGKEEQ